MQAQEGDSDFDSPAYDILKGSPSLPVTRIAGQSPLFSPSAVPVWSYGHMVRQEIARYVWH